MNTRLFLTLMLVVGCDSTPAPSDSGPGGVDSGSDAATAVCARDLDCDDELFCTLIRCRPGEPGAGADGCLVEPGPCATPEACSESDRSCEVECPDADGDGATSSACGGDDCDDFDPNRYPGNAEVCDLERHDEDCVPDTLGDTDEDEDGAISSQCCNGVNCGADCNDADPDASPTVRESCNGRDDDCDGVTDEAAGDPLCPGGVCTSGRCDLGQWDRTFGSRRRDEVEALAMDGRGGIYLIAEFGDVVTVGGEALTAPGLSTDVLIAAYDADGTFRWVRQLSSPGADLASDIVYSPEADLVYVLAQSGSASDDFGGAVVTEPSQVLLALQPDGTVEWSRVGDLSFSVLGTSGGSVLLGGGSLQAISPDNEVLWTTTFTGRVSIEDIDATATHLYFVGEAREDTVDLGLGPHESPRDVFVLRTALDGTPDGEYWAAVQASSSTNLQRMTIAPDGTVVVALQQLGMVNYGTGEALGASQCLALVAMDRSLTPLRTRIILGDARPLDIAATASGVVRIAGGFFRSVNFGSGTRQAVGMGVSGATAFYAFIADFEADLRPRGDLVLAPSGPGLDCEIEPCGSVVSAMAIGPAESTVVGGHFFPSIDLGSGTRFSAPEDEDGFVLRLAN